jgi:hypothetical protein
VAGDAGGRAKVAGAPERACRDGQLPVSGHGAAAGGELMAPGGRWITCRFEGLPGGPEAAEGAGELAAQPVVVPGELPVAGAGRNRTDRVSQMMLARRGEACLPGTGSFRGVYDVGCPGRPPELPFRACASSSAVSSAAPGLTTVSVKDPRLRRLLGR